MFTFDELKKYDLIAMNRFMLDLYNPKMIYVDYACKRLEAVRDIFKDERNATEYAWSAAREIVDECNRGITFLKHKYAKDVLDDVGWLTFVKTVYTESTNKNYNFSTDELVNIYECHARNFNIPMEKRKCCYSRMKDAVEINVSLPSQLVEKIREDDPIVGQLGLTSKQLEFLKEWINTNIDGNDYKQFADSPRYIQEVRSGIKLDNHDDKESGDYISIYKYKDAYLRINQCVHIFMDMIGYQFYEREKIYYDIYSHENQYVRFIISDKFLDHEYGSEFYKLFLLNAVNHIYNPEHENNIHFHIFKKCEKYDEIYAGVKKFISENNLNKKVNLICWETTHMAAIEVRDYGGKLTLDGNISFEYYPHLKELRPQLNINCGISAALIKNN